MHNIRILVEPELATDTAAAGCDGLFCEVNSDLVTLKIRSVV
jgi:hypothetical protein